MKRSVKESKGTLDHINKIIMETLKSRDLTKEGKISKFKEIDVELNRLQKAWNEEFTNSVKEEKEKLQAEAVKLREKVLDRDLSLDEIPKLEYQAKIMLSRLAAEGGGSEEFVKILQDYVIEGTDRNRQAFVDNYLSFSNLADTFEHKGKENLFNYYIRAKRALITPEQEALESKFDEISKLNDTKPAVLFGAESRIKDMRSEYANELWQSVGDNPVKTIWG